ncbi:MAG: hypothetical protein C0598_13790, partial [Marinilabiliales bacterium]
MLKKNTSAIIFLIIISLLLLAYFIYPKLAKTDADPWTMIPSETALILHTESPKDFIDKIKSEEVLWQLLSKSSLITGLDIRLSAVADVLESNTNYHNLLFNSPLSLAIQGDTTTNTANILFLSKIQKSISNNDLKAFLTKNLNGKYAVVDIVERKFGGLKILDTENDQIIYLYENHGVMLISNSLSFLTESINTYKTNEAGIFNDNELIKVKNTAGKRVDASLYINYPNLNRYLNKHITENSINSLSALSNFASWTELDLIIKNEELLFSGFTAADSTKFLWNIKDDPAFTNKIYNLVPFNTNI